MDDAFAGKVVIVTGAASLIGVEIIRQLLDAGASIAACDRVSRSGWR